jgi:hypothetical protein
VQTSDFASCKSIPVSSGTFTVSLVAQASQPPSGQCILILNYGAGVVTVAGNGQNINGSAAAQTLAAGSASTPKGLLVISDGADYEAQPLGGSGATGPTGATGPPGPVSFITNARTSAYQVLNSDFASCKSIPISSGTFTITLVDSTSQPPNGQCILLLNYGSGVVTVARSGQNINGSTASQTLAAGSASAPTGLLVISDGTNYEAQPLGASSGGGTSVLSTVTAIDDTTGWSNFGDWTTQPPTKITGTGYSIIEGTTFNNAGRSYIQARVHAVTAPYSHVIQLFYNASNSATGQVLFSDGTGAVTCGIQSNSSSAFRGSFVTANNEYAAASAYSSGTTAGFSAWAASLPNVALSGLAYFRLADNGTTRTCDYSPDGVSWINIFSHSNTTFLTATEIGYYADSVGTAIISTVSARGYQ